MIINSITLKNFRSYEDETTFSFAPNDDKNIVLIGGENGAGKSTLFEAIKLCLYGPTTYGYLGQNHNYFTKIKNNINDNAFTNKDIECYLGLCLSFKEGTQMNQYYLKRSWNYVNQKINEDFKVYLNDKILDNEKKLYFDKYLHSILPPSLFDFFFFDGEELSDFFTGRSASANLKEAVLELFNYDTFEVLKKHLTSYQRSKSKSDSKLQEVQNTYDELTGNVKDLKSQLIKLDNSIKIDYEELDNLLVKRNQIEIDFKNSGGLLEEEKASYSVEISKLENDRININSEIKDFCNNTLPFLLVSELLDKTKKQIKSEDYINSYKTVSKNLSSTIMKDVLKKYIQTGQNNIDYNEIAIDIINHMFNKNDIENVKYILGLSEEDKIVITHTIDRILLNQDKHSKSILFKFDKISSIRNKLKNLREKLNATIPIDFLNHYLENINSINERIILIQKSIVEKKAMFETKTQELKNKEYHLTRAKNEYSTLLQSNNVLDMSNEIINYLEDLLNTLTTDKIKMIEDEFIKIFSSIIRKDNYVNSIVIDDNFKTTLYINKDYTPNEILNAITNLGIDGLVKKYGQKFLDDLLKNYKLTSTKNLRSIIRKDYLYNYISLGTKINIHDFSNGEKQIYILCLIWAIIKSSGVEIPFIIDTPYARIDESHRNSLTTTYLPNISKQVIILSTNKEIDRELYKVVKPFVCDEYLLLYNNELRKTEVKNGYFEV
jgi:DNA sulfur modification protein DndD